MTIYPPNNMNAAEAAGKENEPMSKFNRYARKVDEIARAAFKEYDDAETAFNKAKAATNATPVRRGIVEAQYAAKAARANADYLEAKNKFDAVRRDMSKYSDQVATLRGELEVELDKAYSVDPSQLDANTLELLKSGILKSGEYARLMDVAQRANNPTMARMIAKYAGEAAEMESKKNGQGDAQAVALRAVAQRGCAFTGDEHLRYFDMLADCFDRSMRNPAMAKSWDSLTSEIVENF